jgi:hypothetical protein
LAFNLGASAAGFGWRSAAKKRAIVVTAGRLAVLLHRLWVTGEVCESADGSMVIRWTGAQERRRRHGDRKKRDIET